ncbi:MAG: undecaprenyldiphospho-muramoylpentapeptide beta-N-acetylglucosaminyltransferase [Geobacter sp.]|nr:undecaprenyldiphospho-muramoylpentapeptide beta-N-acetylglucosaminyltransferase [Geobacter sp.]
MKLIIAGGGTGGHLFPGISVAEEFLSRDPGNEILFVGTERGIEARVLPRLGMPLECIPASGVRGKNGLAKVKGLALFAYGYAESRKILKRFRPDLVLGVGGYASAPLCMAARGMQIGYFVHEQNAIPGLTNRLLARFADQIYISFDEAEKFFPEGRTTMTGNPVRKEIVAGDADEPAGADNVLNLLVFGGSQGAHSINQACIAAAPHIADLRERVVVLHQTGDKDLAEVRAAYEQAGIRATVLPFIDDMAAAYRRADLLVCRAGATTLAEVTACGKACLFIPFPHAVDDHQRRNAEAMLKKDAGFMLLERELSGERLAGTIRELAADPERLAAVGSNARSLARPDAARMIVDEMLKMKG